LFLYVELEIGEITYTNWLSDGLLDIEDMMLGITIGFVLLLMLPVAVNRFIYLSINYRN